jgi:23S rRNA (cytidine1920-2'-O)/16S rRNA (cytidine1409-2'-O)-methyltransferase
MNLEGKTVLDIGQSTGGFTDCCLQAGAAYVIGFDVGENQLHEKIKTNSKVKFFEKQNAKNIHENSEIIKSLPVGGVDVMVCDVSFISLNHIVPAVNYI